MFDTIREIKNISWFDGVGRASAQVGTPYGHGARVAEIQVTKVYKAPGCYFIGIQLDNGFAYVIQGTHLQTLIKST